MENPILFIKKIKCNLEEVLIDNKVNYLGDNVDDILKNYSADFCGLMLSQYPGATIMMNKSFRTCAVMIQGVIYDSDGIATSRNYFIAQKEEVNFIQKCFNHLSDDIMNNLVSKTLDNNKIIDSAFCLRKNRDYLT